MTMGFLLMTRVALGMRRLAIIDLAGGKQPIHNADRTKWIVFNGEIYNYQEIRKRPRSAAGTIFIPIRIPKRSSIFMMNSAGIP